MSMLSSKCDELRDRAMRVEIFLEGSTDAIPTDTHEQLRGAADTIWELRNKLAGVTDRSDEIGALKAENAKLRELVREMYGFVKDACELRPDVLMANNVPDWQVVDYRTPSERYAERLRDLGIEAE